MKAEKRAPRRQPSIEKSLQQQPPALGRDMQFDIGRQLRAIYRDTMNEGPPDRIADLLRRLDAADRQ